MYAQTVRILDENAMECGILDGKSVNLHGVVCLEREIILCQLKKKDWVK